MCITDKATMLTVNLPCFISLSNPDNVRKLLPAKTVELKGKTCVIALDSHATLVPGEELALFAEWHGKFHQQFATIISVQSAEPATVVEVERMGEPVNSESRGIYRVGVVSQDIRCMIGKERDCLLADISVEGIAAVVTRPIVLGTMVQLALTVEGKQAVGAMRVLTEKRLYGDHLRYGMIAPDKNSPLRKALEAITTIMQRKQLRRLSGV